MKRKGKDFFGGEMTAHEILFRRIQRAHKMHIQKYWVGGRGGSLCADVV